jgi:hypothetical protein
MGAGSKRGPAPKKDWLERVEEVDEEPSHGGVLHGDI